VKRIGREVMRFACRDARDRSSRDSRQFHYRHVANPHRVDVRGTRGSPIGMPEQAPSIAARPVQIRDYAGDSVTDQESDLRQVKDNKEI